MTATAAAYVREPDRIARLARDKHGRPVPWFVAWIDGQPDFRIIRSGGLGMAVIGGWCWICGQLFEGADDPRAFVIGPMCGVNLVSAEPPSHYDCAVYAATHCPFLTHPAMTRRDKHRPEGTADPAGGFITRNPGVTLLWVTAHDAWCPVRPRGGGVLFHIGSLPFETEWYAQGRPATRAEVERSIETGLPELRRIAKLDGPPALVALNRQHAHLMTMLPRR